jgi:deoxyinosine 3'endonuclease (endonuclease V)
MEKGGLGNTPSLQKFNSSMVQTHPFTGHEHNVVAALDTSFKMHGKMARTGKFVIATKRR